MREIIGNTIATPNPRPNWEQNDSKAPDYIQNKPKVHTEEEIINLIDTHGGEEQVQADWNEANETAPAYINNKPSLGALASKDEITMNELAKDVQEAFEKANPTLADLGGVPTTEKGIPKGIATLDEKGHISSDQLPLYTDYVDEANGSQAGLMSAEDKNKLDILVAKAITVFSGDAVPSSELGEDGDVYLIID